MDVYLRAKFRVSSIILTSFIQGGNFTPLPPQNEPLKSPPRLGLRTEYSQTCLYSGHLRLLKKSVRYIEFWIFWAKNTTEIKLTRVFHMIQVNSINKIF